MAIRRGILSSRGARPPDGGSVLSIVRLRSARWSEKGKVAGSVYSFFRISVTFGTPTIHRHFRQSRPRLRRLNTPLVNLDNYTFRARGKRVQSDNTARKVNYVKVTFERMSNPTVESKILKSDIWTSSSEICTIILPWENIFIPR